MTAATATFELDRFAWDGGAFEVAGCWKGDDAAPIGRARLVVEVAGRRRRVAAQPAAPVKASPAGERWQARFPFADRPEDGTTAELEVGRALIVELPAAELPPRKRFERDDPEPDRRLAALEEATQRAEEAARHAAQEREAAERAATHAAQEREAAEKAIGELATARRAALAEAKAAATEVAPEPVRTVKGWAPEPPPGANGDELPPIPRIEHRTPRREEIRRALERPREPRSPLDGADPATARNLAYAVAAAIVVFVVILLALVL